MSCSKCVTIENIYHGLKEMEHVFRGPLQIRVEEIEKELEQGKKKPFDRVIRADIGDCQAFGQTPITFIRQVLALVLYPELLNDPNFPEDAKDRAQAILKGCVGCSTGSYPDVGGIKTIRRRCAEYITNRDGIPADWQNIITGNGSLHIITIILELLTGEVNGKKVGIMVPVPRNPFYSASITELNMHLVPYYLDEATNWSITVSELERAISDKKDCCKPRAIVVINPGNPTGQVLTRKNIEEVIKFAYEENLFLLADEGYQQNIYDPNSEFVSFKKVLTEMGPPYNEMELASFMSNSKGFMGECGLRGGYVEMINLDPDVHTTFIGCMGILLCSNTIGQAILDCLATPLKKGDPSYELFEKEKNYILNSLKERAQMIYDAFNSCEGMSCNIVQGAMYAFPQIKLPPKAIEKAKSLNQCPSVFYCYHLLEQTGVSVVPGAEFGQVEGTYHFRVSISLQPKELKYMLNIIKAFHKKFIAEYK